MSKQCIVMTQKGTRCRKRTKHVSGKCFLHMDKNVKSKSNTLVSPTQWIDKEEGEVRRSREEHAVISREMDDVKMKLKEVQAELEACRDKLIMKTKYTISRYIWSHMKRKMGGRIEQHEPDIGFSSYLLPNIMPEAYKKTSYFSCKESMDKWYRGRTETVKMPITINCSSKGGDHVDQLLYETISDRIFELEDGVKRDQCESGISTITKNEIRPPKKLPPFLVISAVRSNLWEDPTQKMEEPQNALVPSESVTIFNKKYRLSSMSIKFGPADAGHWVACVRTTTGWYMMNDMRVVPITDITKHTNGVQFIYDDAELPLFDIGKGLPNPSTNWMCWSNTFQQMVKYSAGISQKIGVESRAPTDMELFSLIDLET